MRLIPLRITQGLRVWSSSLRNPRRPGCKSVRFQLGRRSWSRRHWPCAPSTRFALAETNAPFRRWCVVCPAGQTAEALGDLDRAVASYESALRHNAYSVVALSQIAAICRSKEEFKKAAEYFGRVVGIAPESGDVWGALGKLYSFLSPVSHYVQQARRAKAFVVA
jgi:tetratricopeptide (TPR) repeat protein